MKKAAKQKSAGEVGIVNFLYEVGSLRKVARAHRQALLTDDLSDNIASHSYRVAVISWFIAKGEKLDPYKTVMMALMHDVAEARSNDHNWLHKKYTKIFEDEITKEQLGVLPYPDLQAFVEEYTTRESAESIATKDADLLDQILLLREYELAGNKEASLWLHGKSGKKESAHVKKLRTKTAARLGKEIYEVGPSEWWRGIWTSENRA